MRVFIYLKTLNPFDGWITIRVSDLAKDLEVSKSTVSKALSNLSAQGMIDMDIRTARVRISSNGKMFPTGNKVSYRKQSFLQETKFPTGNDPNPETPSLSGFQAAGITNKQNNIFKKTNNIGRTPPTHPVVDKMNKDGNIKEDGHISKHQDPDLARLLVQKANIQPNKTIRQILDELESQLGSAAAARLVENAIAALQEQQKLGRLRNPEGFLVTALRRSFTPNDKRSRKEDPPSLNQISLAIDRALWQGDRHFALERLQGLWAEGWHDLVEELLQLRRDWGFQITMNGVTDLTDLTDLTTKN
jgi:predicted ArsR family transcriptional regulator